MLIKVLIIRLIIIMVRIVLILAIKDNRKIDRKVDCQPRTNTKCLTLAGEWWTITHLSFARVKRNNDTLWKHVMHT